MYLWEERRSNSFILIDVASEILHLIFSHKTFGIFYSLIVRKVQRVTSLKFISEWIISEWCEFIFCALSSLLQIHLIASCVSFFFRYRSRERHVVSGFRWRSKWKDRGYFWWKDQRHVWPFDNSSGNSFNNSTEFASYACVKRDF